MRFGNFTRFTVLKVLVTGASGFVGAHLVSRLAKEGYQVRTFGRSVGAGSPVANVEHYRGDICDRDSVAKAVDGCHLAFHLAGFVSYRAADRPEQERINVLGTRIVAEECLRAGCARFIYTGSIAGMGIPAPGTVGTEEIEYNLSGRNLSYCDTKFAGEQEVHRLIKEGLPAIILNPGIIFGEGDTHPHHGAIFLALSKGWLIGCPAGGVSFCDIRDVVDAHLNAMTRGRVGERYVLASDNLTYLEAAGIVSHLLGRRKPTLHIPGWLIEGAGALVESTAAICKTRPALTRQVAWLSQQRIFFSSKKAQNELDYACTPFAETVRRTAPHYIAPTGGAMPESTANFTSARVAAESAQCNESTTAKPRKN